MCLTMMDSALDDKGEPIKPFAFVSCDECKKAGPYRADGVKAVKAWNQQQQKVKHEQRQQ